MDDKPLYVLHETVEALGSVADMLCGIEHSECLDPDRLYYLLLILYQRAHSALKQLPGSL